MTEVNKLVAFSPPLCFLCLLLFPLFSRTAHGVSSSAPVGFSEESRFLCPVCWAADVPRGPAFVQRSFGNL